jgi:hypothetical protein
MRISLSTIFDKESLTKSQPADFVIAQSCPARAKASGFAPLVRAKYFNHRLIE